jgi:hypothetical protein
MAVSKKKKDLQLSIPRDGKEYAVRCFESNVRKMTHKLKRDQAKHFLIAAKHLAAYLEKQYCLNKDGSSCCGHGPNGYYTDHTMPEHCYGFEIDKRFKAEKRATLLEKHFGVGKDTKFVKCPCGGPMMTNEERSSFLCMSCAPIIISAKERYIEGLEAEINRLKNPDTCSTPEYKLAE